MSETQVIVPDLRGEELLDWFRSLSTSRLKKMWDGAEGDEHCDEIHVVMNERGQGGYVAV